MPKKQNRVRLTTPKGVAKYPYLTSPDTKFDSAGIYRTSLLLDPKDPGVEDFLAQLDSLADEAYEKAVEELKQKGKKAMAKQVTRQAPYIQEVDEDGNETGMVEVRFKCKAKVESKRHGKTMQLRPRLFDSKGNPIDPDDISIYGGSVIRVNFTPSPFFVASSKMAGVSLLLNAVQVIELVSGGGADAESYGFTEEEGFEVGVGGGSVDDVNEDANGGEYGDSDEDEDLVDF